jgi:hypothetical protein
VLAIAYAFMTPTSFFYRSWWRLPDVSEFATPPELRIAVDIKFRKAFS